jgi:hypothetical protein
MYNDCEPLVTRATGLVDGHKTKMRAAYVDGWKFGMVELENKIPKWNVPDKAKELTPDEMKAATAGTWDKDGLAQSMQDDFDGLEACETQLNKVVNMWKVEQDLECLELMKKLGPKVEVACLEAYTLEFERKEQGKAAKFEGRHHEYVVTYIYVPTRSFPFRSVAPLRHSGGRSV